MATAVQCAWCGKPLLDREHALAHGPVCPASPVVAAVRRRALLEASDAAEELAWVAALRCPPEESAVMERISTAGGISALTMLAAAFREQAGEG